MEDKIKVYTKIHLFSWYRHVAVLKKKKKTNFCESGKTFQVPPYLLATLELGLENIFHLLIKKF